MKTQFIKAILTSNFLLLENCLTLNKKFQYGIFLNSKNKMFCILNLESCLRDLKQFIRNFKFILEKPSLILLIISNNQIYFLYKTYIDLFFKELNNLFFIHRYFFFHLFFKNPLMKSGLIIQDYDNYFLIKRMFVAKFFIISEITKNFANYSVITYKNFNDFNNLKKFVFLLSLLNQLIKIYIKK